MADSDKDVDGRAGDDKDVDGRGGLDNSGDLVAEILSRATSLGGFLVVSIVAPLPPRRGRTGTSTTETPDALAVAAQKAANLEAERTILTPDVKKPASPQ